MLPRRKKFAIRAEVDSFFLFSFAFDFVFVDAISSESGGGGGDEPFDDKSSGSSSIGTKRDGGDVEELEETKEEDEEEEDVEDDVPEDDADDCADAVTVDDASGGGEGEFGRVLTNAAGFGNARYDSAKMLLL